jgi:hypothetical protein
MVRIHNGWLAYGFAAALLTAGPFAFADDPTQQNQDPQQSSSSDSDKSDKSGATTPDKSAQGQTQAQAHDKMDKEKDALRDKVKKQIDDAQAHIDELQTDVKNKTGAARLRDERLLKEALRYRDDLNVDLIVIETATAQEWNAIRTMANADLNNFKGVVKRVAIARKAMQPRGKTNVQPQGGSKDQSGSDTNKK